jgi:hypothetical protein
VEGKISQHYNTINIIMLNIIMLDINTIVYQLPIEVNSTEIIKDVERYIIPRFKVNVLETSAGLNVTDIPGTTNWFNGPNGGNMAYHLDGNTGERVFRNYEKFTLGFPGKWRDDILAYYKDDTCDRDYKEWPLFLKESSLFTMQNKIAEYLVIDTHLRCRMSFLHGPFSIGYHSDPHTPWRAHINLKSGKETKWLFKSVETKQVVEWKQPPDTVWLIRTGNVQHAVEVEEGAVRWHLFYHIWQRNLGPNYYNKF